MPAVMISMARGLLQLLAGLAKPITIYPTQTYRPEAHCMRGPGPKWREKHMR
jgi:hypothetical protein